LAARPEVESFVDHLPKEGPMRKKFLALPLVALLGGWQFLQKFEVDLQQLSVKPRAEQAAPAGTVGQQTLPPVRPGDLIRVASFNIQVFGDKKLSDPKVAPILAQIIRKFDVVAIQEVRTEDATFMNRFLQMINLAGVPYDAVVGPRLGRTVSKEQYAFIFDTTRIEIDRVSVYTVKDPDDLLHREPLVAGFRARGPDPNQAFTFTLIDIHTDPDEKDNELNALDDVFRAVRDDGRGEDDVILLGDLNSDEAHLGQLGALPYISYVISGVPTNTRGNKTYDNILFDRRATTEFLGRGGVLDVMREFNLTVEDALLVSDHLPIWAEFSVYEGGRPGNVAAKPAGVTQ
jgi:endonuclease/exonuclease/phosphatase family metal-dependent hydrolase